jgi:hypothetical protein
MSALRKYTNRISKKGPLSAAQKKELGKKEERAKSEIRELMCPFNFANFACKIGHSSFTA